MKKLVALLLATLMLASCMSFASADEPIVLQFWHHAGSGGIYNAVSAAVANFNATVGAEKGIVVEEVYIGAYADLFAKTQLAVQAGEAPDVAVVSNAYVPFALSDDFLIDMAPYAARDGVDLNNILDCFMEIGGNQNGEFHSIPYCRSTPVIYYNKALVAEAGLNWEDEGHMVPIEEVLQLGEYCKAYDANGNQIRWGYSSVNDFTYLSAAHIYQMGSSYMSAEGEGAPISQTDGALLKVLSDWRGWIDEGLYRSYESTDASNVNIQLVLSGNLAAYPASCSGLTKMMKKCDEAGIDLGIAYFPTYDVNNHVALIGGGNVAMIEDSTTTEETKNASWEFVKFLLADEQVATVHLETGYFPVTKSAVNDPRIVELWSNDHRYAVAYEQALSYGKCQETPVSSVFTEYLNIVVDAVSVLIQEGATTPEEAVQLIIDESADLW